MKKVMKNPAIQALVASLICIALGILIGYIVLLFINPSGAGEAIVTVLKSFFKFSSSQLRVKNFGNTVAKTIPLLMCSLSILFAYKVGLFNIGVAGQYVAGACGCLYAGLAWGWHWFPCLLLAILCGCLFGFIVGLLKAYCNVNEVISGIMLNWISLYGTNTILSNVKEVASPYTFYLSDVNPGALLPRIGLDKLFNNEYVTIAVPVAIIIAVIVMILLDKTMFGYELKATGFNKNAAKYCGMAEQRNIIVTLVIAGALAGFGAALFYLTGFTRWECTQSSVPGMGFNGIAAAFLGGLNPIGSIVSSFFIQHITDGGSYVNTNYYCAQISDLISSVIIYLCGFVLFIKLAMNKMLSKEDKKVKPAGAEKEGGKQA